MVELVDDISANALKSMVAGETLDTAAPLGLASKLSIIFPLSPRCQDEDGQAVWLKLGWRRS